MFLKSLKIENEQGIIRQITFRSGLNLIIDETPSDNKETTGNNVGKTTVLVLIDFCLGANAKEIYADPENKKTEYEVVKNFLIETKVLVTLTLTENLTDPLANEILIERNFLAKNQRVRRINGVDRTEDEFEEFLTNALFENHYGKKPTFPQITSHNIRYKELSLTNTLRTLSAYTTDVEYETLHLFLFGCHFQMGGNKQKIITQIRLETNFKASLESSQTKSGYQASLALLLTEIDELNQKKSTFRVNSNFEADLQRLDNVKYKINLTRLSLSRLKLRKTLVTEAINEIDSNHFKIDMNQLKDLYKDAIEHLSKVQKSFEDLVQFHNQMVEEKARYISKELPSLDANIKKEEQALSDLLTQEKRLSEELSKSTSFEELEELISVLNEKHFKKGEYETTIQQIEIVEKNISELNEQLKVIDDQIFSSDFQAQVQKQVNKFNIHFAKISQELYGEKYAIKFDIVTNKKGQKLFKFSSFNTNMSSGKKQGEITCFDIAYTLFADQENIPCFHFLLNDKKELMHDHQLTKIAKLVENEKSHIQFVASILKDKLPTELNKEEYFVLQLSQDNKLFKIESDKSN